MSVEPVKSGESGELGKVVIPSKAVRRKVTSSEAAGVCRITTPAKKSRCAKSTGSENAPFIAQRPRPVAATTFGETRRE